MEYKLNILICDINEDYRKELISYFKEIGSFRIFSANNGLDAINIINENTIHVVLLNLILFEIDGLEVLKYINENSKKVKTIILSEVTSSELIIKALRLGAWYYLLKGSNKKIIYDRIIDCTTLPKIISKHKENINEIKVRYNKFSNMEKILFDIGFFNNLRSHKYIFASLKEINKDRSLLFNIQDKMYPKISKKFKVSIGTIESSIRKSIKKTYLENNVFRELCKNNKINKAPTNKQFYKLIISLLN